MEKKIGGWWWFRGEIFLFLYFMRREKIWKRKKITKINFMG